RLRTRRRSRSHHGGLRLVRFGILICFFFFQAEDGIRDYKVTGVQTCALPISNAGARQCREVPGNERFAAHPHQGLGERVGDRARSEERRVGKECRSRGWPYGEKKTKREREPKGVSRDDSWDVRRE